MPHVFRLTRFGTTRVRGMSDNRRVRRRESAGCLAIKTGKKSTFRQGERNRWSNSIYDGPRERPLIIRRQTSLRKMRLTQGTNSIARSRVCAPEPTEIASSPLLRPGLRPRGVISTKMEATLCRQTETQLKRAQLAFVKP